jgi:hypothetical protein
MGDEAPANQGARPLPAAPSAQNPGTPPPSREPYPMRYSDEVDVSGPVTPKRAQTGESATREGPLLDRLLSGVRASVPSQKYVGIREPMHPVLRRCSSVEYRQGICALLASCRLGASALSVRQPIPGTEH